MGIFNTLASELVDDDADYLAIVLQEIAGRFALQEVDDNMAQEEAACATDPAHAATELSSLDVIAQGEQATQDQPGEPTIEMVSNVGPLGATPSDAAGASVPAFGSALPAPLRRPSFSGATPRGVRGALPGLDQVDEL